MTMLSPSPTECPPFIGSFAAHLIGTGTAIVIAFGASWFLLPFAEKRFDDTVAIPAENTSSVVPGQGSQQGTRENETAQTTPGDGADATQLQDSNAPSAHPVESPATDVATSAAVVSPIEGTVIDLKDVPDKVFASGAMGMGVGIKPSSGVITSPVEGTVIAAPRSGHAYGIRSASGVEVLIHVGVDTVKMNGEGFTTSVSRGDHVTTGQPLGTADLGAISASGYDDTTVVVVTNSQKLADVSLDVSAGRSVSHDVLFTVTP
ncbi:PTS sugar transporter subunit IIA [Corynebacterium parakroppenstedtii]|uniref:PTS sugar transporter subunit IIA n=4 Tax=Corynebacterium parakroppenstedtii TaxID=2828363 RepID=UPI001C8D0907|nr:PTS glucose transporter subunit IIA [Corynebacterium parakroppenstedtii]